MNIARHAPGSVRAASVADELAIMRLLAAHQNAITIGDVTAYVDTFAVDARLVNHAGEVCGREAVAAQFRSIQADISVRDLVTNCEIEIAGAEATARAATFVITMTPPPVLLAATTLTARLRRIDAAWYFVELVKAPDPSFDPAVGTIHDELRRVAQWADV